uniref:Amine oxidase domain-containing protein n=1 Tax=Mycena chlorophos TaxID=658473 RepID=A0ABQ0LXG9_MYCCL|nr:predicted protein [Mycena chlorophos]
MLSPLTAFSWSVLAPTLARSPTSFLPTTNCAIPTGICLLPIAVVVAFICTKLWPRTRHEKGSDALVPIQALLTVITPVAAAWPRDYLPLVDHTTNARSKTVSVSLISLIDAICRRDIEFRNHEDFVEFLAGRLVAYGWRVQLALDGCVAFKVLGWVVGSYFSWKPYKTVDPRRVLKRTHGASSPKESITLDTLLQSHNTHIDLDRTPLSQINSALAALGADLAPGQTAIIEFTTPATEIEFLSAEFIVCAVPLMARKCAPASRRATTTPLFADLNSVLAQLTQSTKLVLESVTNISKDYAAKLVAAAEQLDGDKSIRTPFVDKWGLEGYSEERFMLGWEAALFESGTHLARWKIVVAHK